MHSEPNFSLPWQRRRQYSSTSSGFAIPGHRRILTNAHSVDHFTQVGSNSHCRQASGGGHMYTCWSHMSQGVFCPRRMASGHVSAALLHLPAPLSVQVKVRRRGSESKFVAKVLAVGAECDIGEPCRGLLLSSVPHCNLP